MSSIRKKMSMRRSAPENVAEAEDRKTSSVHSERALEGTRSQIEGIITWLEDQVKQLKEERTKIMGYGVLGAGMIPHLDQRVVQSETQLVEYQRLRSDYKRRGLI